MKQHDLKLLALDLDGTLTNAQKEVSAANREAIRRAQEMGVSVVLASGRPLIGIRALASTLNLWETGGYILAYNGGHILDCRSGADIVKQTIPMEMYGEIFTVGKMFPVHPLAYNDVGVICENDTDPYVRKEAYNCGIPVIKVANLLEAVTTPAVKLLAVGEPAELRKAHAYLSEKFAGRLNVFFSEPYFMEITPPGIEKASALGRLTAHLGYTAENVMACGDGLNDIPMLQYAGLAVAMANAYDETKQYADYISASNEEDGVAEAIKRFILNEQ